MYKNFGVITFQAEDEIAAITSAIGAAYARRARASPPPRGPGMALKTEAHRASRSMVELPLVIVDIQRGGPSTGLPTKTEQADLLQALFGRNSEAPVPVHRRRARPATASGSRSRPCRIALKYMMPVIVLSDGYLANGAEPWQHPDARRAARRFPVDVPHRSRGLPALRARPRRRWRGRGPIPGTPGPRAPHRRPREAGRHRQRQLRAAQPRADGAAARGRRWRRIVAGHPRRGARGRPRRRPADRRLGLDLRRHHRGAARRSARRAAASATCTCAT